MKFRVGSRVRVKDNSRLDGAKWAGKRGKVTQVEKDEGWPYLVSFSDGYAVWFHANELERVE